MNKFIETDLHNGKHYTYCGVMNVISELENGHLIKYDFGNYVPYSMFKEILEERGWTEKNYREIKGWKLDFSMYWTSPQNKTYSVSGCFVLGGLKIELNNEIN